MELGMQTTHYNCGIYSNAVPNYKNITEKNIVSN